MRQVRPMSRLKPPSGGARGHARRGPSPKADDEDESFAEAALIDPRSGPEAEERAYEEAVIEGQADPAAADPGEPARLEADLEEAAQPAADWDAPPKPNRHRTCSAPFVRER